MKILSNIFLFVLLILCEVAAPAQTRREHCVMFYNAENLFHPSDDSTAADDDFTPGGIRRWNFYRYNMKIAAICKVILSANGWEPPDVICLSEIENRQVLDDLVYHPLLLGQSYIPLHRDSPDHRGMDVGILYRADLLKCLDTTWIGIRDAAGKPVHTREILSATFRYKHTRDTVVIYANHWTSKYGGALETAERRMWQSRTLGNHIEEVLAAYPEREQNITVIAGGDLNDLSGAAPVLHLTRYHLLEEVFPSLEQIASQSFNLPLNKPRAPSWFSFPGSRSRSVNELRTGSQTAAETGSHVESKAGSQTEAMNKKRSGSQSGSRCGSAEKMVCGTYKYKGNWGSIDHVFTGGKLRAENCHAMVFYHPLLLEEDSNYTGEKPFRTYIGFKYNGGISDHLPLLLHFVLPGVEGDD